MRGFPKTVPALMGHQYLPARIGPSPMYWLVASPRTGFLVELTNLQRSEHPAVARLMSLTSTTKVREASVSDRSLAVIPSYGHSARQLTETQLQGITKNSPVTTAASTTAACALSGI
jgi:hypothetical protein